MSEVEKPLECTFTWLKNEPFDKIYDENLELKIEIDEQPILALMQSIINTHSSVIKKDCDNAKIKMAETLQIWNAIDRKEKYQRQIKEENISSDVLLHIIKATQYHVCEITNDESEAKRIMSDLTDSENFSTNIDLGTLNGCKSIVWSSFHEIKDSHKNSLRYVNLAIDYSPNCPLWHFIAEKNYRRERRITQTVDCLTKEKESMLKCDSLSNSSFYKAHVARMYLENKEFKKAKPIFLKLYNLNLSSATVQFIMIKAFMWFQDFERANTCFNKVEEQYKNNSMFLHYKGIYFDKKKDYETAVTYYEKSAKLVSFRADLSYIICKKKLNKNFDCIQHLETMLEKYVFFKHYVHEILLYLSMQYYKKGDIVKASINFLRAIKTAESVNDLKDFRNITDDNKIYNIFNFIRDQLLPKLELECSSYDERFSQENQNILEELRDLLRQHNDN